MSPRKLTEDDKHEILNQYRNSEATTSTLAKSFEVSSSTISRFLKNNLSSLEYEDLIQQKRLARTPRGEKSTSKAESTPQKTKTKTKTKSKSESKTKQKQLEIAIADNDAMPELATSESPQVDLSEETETESNPTSRRRRRSTMSEPVLETAETIVPEVAESEPVLETAETTVPEIAETESNPTPRRRRRSTTSKPVLETTETTVPEVAKAEEIAEVEEPTPVKLILDKKVRSKSDSEDTPESEQPRAVASPRLVLKGDRVEPEEEEDDDDDTLDITALKEMLGEDIDDDDDDDWEDDEDEDDDSATYHSQRTELSDIQILPLSQASLPRTCYLVIDRLAELIVKPLEDFADLGTIPETEVRQRTLPVFDNHRIAKRFSHRRERVIKVPDGRMLQKTSHYLQDKGITRLLIDGQIYSLSK